MRPSAVRRTLGRVIRERQLPSHLQGYLGWKVRTHIGSPPRIVPAPVPVKPALSEAASILIGALDEAGAFVFLIDDRGHTIHVGLGDEDRGMVRDITDLVLPGWTVHRTKSSIEAYPEWTSSGGAHITFSLWQRNDLGERECVGKRGLHRLFASDIRTTASLAGNDVPAAPSFVPEPLRLRPRFPIDAVITWVDDTDPEWIRRKQTAARSASPSTESDSVVRFRSRDELKYLLRSIDTFAPFFRSVFIVTDCRPPDWLDCSNPRIRLVDQSTLLGGEPVFNSLAVETALHHIDGLSEHYVYFNDDMFIARPLEPEVFFSAAGHMRVSDGPLIRSGTPSSADNAFESSAQQARDLVEESLGWRPERSANHVPLPQNRTVAHAMEERFADALHATRVSTFRSPDNTTSATGLIHYLGAELGQLAKTELHLEYIDTGSRLAPARYAALLWSPGVDFICCNDASPVHDETRDVEQDLREFLECYYPVPSEFETSD